MLPEQQAQHDLQASFWICPDDLRPGIESMSAPASTTTNGATLLIVDDDARTRKKLRQIFGDAGYRVFDADDAPSALRLLSEETCDLVVLDLEMPDVDGFALCRMLRAQPATTNLPVVVSSASA